MALFTLESVTDSFSSYLRTRPAAQAIQFTVDQSMLNEVKANNAAAAAAKPVIKAEPTVQSISNGVSGLAINGTTKTNGTTNGATNSTHVVQVKSEPTTPQVPSASTVAPSDAVAKAAAEDPEFAEALRRQAELDEARLQCSIDNKDACLMCSG